MRDKDTNAERDDDNRPVVQLVGHDGNAFSILGVCRKSMRKAKWSHEKIEDILSEMMSGDYDHLLTTAMKYFEVE